MDNIVNKFLQAQNRLVFQSSDLSLDAIANMVEGGAIDIKPKYQRRERWSKDKQSALIESFLLNIPVPPIYLSEDEYGKYSIIDGKQRVTAIYNFILKENKLINLEKFKEIENLTFEQLPPQLNNALKIRPYIRVITLLNQSDSLLKYEVFNRLNTGGDKLNSQEIRNAAFEGKFNDLLVELSESIFFRKQFNLSTEKDREKSKIYKEMSDVEYVLRFFTLKDKWQNFNGNMRVSMDIFMEENRDITQIQLKDYKHEFHKTLELCEKVWGDQAFKRPDGRNEIIQGIYDVQTIGLSQFLDKEQEIIKKKADIVAEFENQYFSDDEFQTSMRQFTSNIKQVNYRISKMIEILNSIL
ncbi:MAG: hypothetical protein K0R59_2742 [Sphingobacterium sp.]|jgi:uncharacterized protein with ParB-like and HNH nuclease domain|nr:hypothetical protein [Sphingobacterium sp.]